ncbi:MAG TPA: protein-glutamate O-methyltransferase CheR [Oscillatoriaceae cyanobacterium]
MPASNSIAPEPRPPLFDAEELAHFKARMSPLVGFDLDAYKPRQIERRITALMARANMPTLDAFHAQLAADPGRLRDFVDGLMINVTEFLRDAEHFDRLRTDVLPDLLARFERLRVWSAGCSVGAELYSVGMLLSELGVLDRAELVGTDLDRGAIERAHEGVYSAYETQGLSDDQLARYFSPEGPGHRFENAAIRERCAFSRHNLLEDPPLEACQLILCRNVVIYLSDFSKRRLYARLHEALAPGGILFVGKTERIFDAGSLGLEPHGPYFYRKSDA